MTFPDANDEFQQAWSQTAGKVMGLREAVSLLENRAQNLYINRRDDAADQVREMATTLKRSRDHSEEELNLYIKEAARRNYEVRQKQPGHPGVVKGPAHV